MKPFKDLISARTQEVLEQDRRIQRVITQSVPALAPHLRMARLEGGRLRLTVQSNAWLSRGRFLSRQIIDAMEADGMPVHDISWHVLPKLVSNRARAGRRIRLQPTARGAAGLAACAAGEGDERLRSALLRLARQLKP